MSSHFSEYVHQLGKASRWVVAEQRSDGSYVARLRNPEPGGLHSYQSRSLLAIAGADVRVYITRAGALRAARRIYGGDL